MDIIIRKYEDRDIPSMVEIWNDVVEDANAFPQIDKLSEEEAREFFASQTFTGVAEGDGAILGLYILHPNNIGRCGHISNASYAVDGSYRGYHIGEKLVLHSMKIGREFGFSILQFNAVVSTNAGAIHLYEKIGFHRVGVIPKGYLLGNGEYEDIIIYYIEL
ncbi:GNAT family N-acetyltransferase [Clostridium cylindrosporum]|uniref:Acetyltransferase n=1 Tax=Clostridium cylindrosporum DSM 605 TaxID=1121307 RepID=A0A0J8D8W1_CLOCY|nr:GNAT family N-acetyltransferase [Clostridium cylindrosporum]KMT22485.1 acetyltransferase [Clostridium cylindrosporum DSM 605]